MAENFATITAVIALLISLVAAGLTFWQTKLLRRAIEAQTYTTLLERAKEIELSLIVDFINSLSCTDYATFQQTVSPECQSQIRKLVDFFNDLSHMIRNGYLNDFYPMRIYRPTLLTCARKLLPWWLDGIRTDRGIPSIYNNFQWICAYTLYLEDEKVAMNLPRIPHIGYRRYLEDHGITQ